MSWGGSGAALLGLEGEVDLDDWRALFATGGPHHPDSHERLVRCLRPGMELVISPGKSVADLGVIGRAEDMHAIAGRRYRAGDRVITLAPGPGGAWATSERAVVSSIDAANGSLITVTHDGRQLHMGTADVGIDKLAYGFAMTAHRSHGATVGTTYALADGGGRELACVAMSRARGESHVYVVANDLSGVVERLVWEWGQERRQSWALDRKPEKSLAQLYAERARLAASLPRDRSGQLLTAKDDLARLERDARDLYDGTGRWAGHPAGQAALAARETAVEYQHAGYGYVVRPADQLQHWPGDRHTVTSD